MQHFQPDYSYQPTDYGIWRFGGDPEAFISRDGKIIPAHSVGLQRQDNPLVLPSACGARVFRDGYAAEINVQPSMSHWLPPTDFESAVRTLCRDLKVDIVCSASVDIDLTDVKTWPLDVVMSGCNPTINAYKGLKGVPEADYPKIKLADATPTELLAYGVEKPDINLETHPRRYAGGHIHFSKLGGDVEEWYRRPNMTIKLIDKFVGLPSTVANDEPTEFARRQFYGKAGEYRIGRYKDGRFGLEYRVLSSAAWTSAAQIRTYMQSIQWVVENFAKEADAWDTFMEEPLQRAINKEEAKGLRGYLMGNHAWKRQTSACVAIQKFEKAA
jgi:hypothetical protein